MVRLRDKWRNYWGHEKGAVSISAGLMLPLFVFLTGSGVELGYAYWQYNAAQQAARIGLRVAVTTNPVAKTVRTMQGLWAVEPGEPLPDYKFDCDGKTRSCSGKIRSYNVSSSFDRSSFNRIFYGSSGRRECFTTDEQPGICDVFPDIHRRNIKISYQASGLGKAGNPADPKPFVTVKLTGLSIDFAFLSIVIPDGAVTLPDIEVTALSEDLKSAW